MKHGALAALMVATLLGGLALAQPGPARKTNGKSNDHPKAKQEKTPARNHQAEKK